MAISNLFVRSLIFVTILKMSSQLPNVLQFFSVTYNSVEEKYEKLRVFCPVTGTPKPIITWKLDKVNITPNPRYSIVDGVLIIHNPRVSDSQTHICAARNKAGSIGYITVHVVIKPQLQNNNSFYSVTYKSVEGKYKILKIYCPVPGGSSKSIIKWQLDKVNIAPSKFGTTGSYSELTLIIRPNNTPCKDPRYSFADGALIIHNPQVSDSQTHKCEARNKAGSSGYIPVHVTIQQLPNITSSSSVIFKSVEGKDEHLKIPCVATGSPKPIITWKLHNVNISPNSKFSIIDGALIIHKPQVGDSQKYKCEAKNDAGFTSATFQTDIQQPPSIISSSSVIFKSVEGKDNQLKIPCVATGSPKPIITWKLNNVNISPNSKYSIVDGALIIHKPQVTDSQKYQCEAKNDAGSTYATFQTDIQQMPEVSGEANKIVTSGGSIKIECKVNKGAPTPTITWQFKSKTNSNFVSVPGSEKVLRILNVNANHTGIYKCLAHNIVGDSTHLTALTVGYVPIITSNNTTIYKGIEGDKALRVPCTAIGVPQPVVIWKADGVKITPNEHYTIADGALVIKNPKMNDSKLYTCEVKNYLGFVQASYKAEIYPNILPFFSVTYNSVEGKYKKLRVFCPVTGTPKPIITWHLDKVNISPNPRYSFVDGALIIDNPRVSDSQTHICEARNKAGSIGYITVHVVIKPQLRNINSFFSITYKSVEGKYENMMLFCPVASGTPKPIIKWKLDKVNISPNPRYTFADGALIIHNPRVSDSQTHICEVKNKAGSFSYITVHVVIQLLPNITSSSSVIFKSAEGKDELLKIPCVATGFPKPTITWKLNDVNISTNSKYSIIDGALIIHKPQVDDSQKYKCEAKNDVGFTYATFQTYIQKPPSITANTSVIFKSVEGKDNQLKIPCVATGSPMPTISWKLNNAIISPNSKYSIIDGALIIHKPQVGDSQKYKCEAKNEAGSTYATFQTDIQQPPSIISSSSVIFKSVEGKDTQLKIPCVATGSPKPIITWKLKNVNISPNSKYSIIDGALIIHNPQVGDSQKYQCEAKNDAGSTYTTFQADIQQPPSIISSSSVIFRSIEGKDTQLKIPCVATGSPKPTVTWKLNDVNISPNSKYSILDGALIIHKPQVGDSQKYKCEAKNEAGSTYATFRIDVQQSPSIISSPSVIFRSVEGKDTQLKIPCVVTGSPKPTVTWKLNNVNISPNSKYSILDGALIIHEPQVGDSQKYKCEAKNEAGFTYATFQTDIQQPPRIISNSLVIFKSVEGKDEPLKIPCVATGSPKPTITWRIDNVTVSPNSKYSIIDGALIIHKPQVGDSQKYKCEAKNDAGSTYATFQTNIQQPPSIISSSSVIPKSVEGKDEQLKIPCVATGSPKPTITWKLNNVNISPNSKYSIVDGALIIHKPQVGDSQKYQCEAKNEAGSTYATFQTDIQQSPSIISNSSIIFRSIEGIDTQLKIPCVATGSPKPTVTWKLNNVNISPNSKYSIIDGALIIHEPQVGDSQEYKCEAKNDAGFTYATFLTDVQQPPSIISSSLVIFKSVEGKDKQLKIPCVATGFPKPIITWKLHNVTVSPNSKYSILDGVLIIHKPQVSDSQKYQCEAKNEAGSTYAMFQTDIQQSPSIISNSSIIFRSIEGKDTQLKIPCVATGSPKPTVTWKLNDVNISPNSKYSIIDGVLIIHEPQVGDSQTYTCEAKNDAGFTYTTFLTDIQQPPRIISNFLVIFKSVEGKDELLKIPCVATGSPKPTITWKLHNVTVSPNSKYSILNGALIIHKPQVGDSQKYKCEAKNEAGSTYATFQTNIQQPPSIISSSSVILKSVEGEDEQLKIPCVATGSPKPTITWKLNNANISPNSKYSIVDGALIIHTPQVSDSQKYQCEAKNEAGSTYATFQTDIQQSPSIISNSSIIFRSIEGKDTQLKIPCVATGSPKPTVTWKLNNVNISPNSKYSIIDGALIIHEPQVGDSQEYKCEAKNDAGFTYATFLTDIQQPPTIISRSSVIFRSIEGKDTQLKIPCVATGFPKPTVTWKLNDVNISPNSKYSIINGALIIHEPHVGDSQEYKCEAKNDAGFTYATFLTDVQQPPNIISSTLVIFKSVEGKDEQLKIPCVATGFPKPIITWKLHNVTVSPNSKYSILDGALIIHKPQVSDSQKYQCEAKNEAGSTYAMFQTDIQQSPSIISRSSVILNSVEGKYTELKIPCVATGSPKPIVTWKLNNVNISPSFKYSIVDGALIIHKPQVNDSQKYLCEAKNDAGSTYATFQADIYQMPEVSGEAEKTVITGGSADIECKVIKGAPNPNITWQFKSKTNSDFVPIPGSENVFHISKVDANHTGIYKCVAHNIVGDSTHQTTLTVEYIPVITSNNSTIYKGIEGDIALSVPCTAIGVPHPVVTWKADGVVITSNEHYMIADGVLVIKNPKKSDSKTYTCEAKNCLGLVEASYTVEVSQFLDDFGTIQEVNILQGATTKLECGSTNSSQSIRWFIEGNDSGIKGKYYNLKNADVSFDGNYTCRFSDMNGAQTRTYVVIVGYPPTFTYEQDSIVDWSGREDDELICEVEAKPAADIVWKFEGKVLVDQKLSILTVPGNWGHYTCDVSNVHGSVHRSFEVQSSDCLISRKSRIGNMPLILTSESTWPVLDSTTDYLQIKSGQTILFSCPNHGDSKNSLKMFPEMNEISATCDKQDVFIVQDKQYKAVDLQCTHEIDVMVIQKPVQCLTNNSKLVHVGFEVHDFLETYEVCFENSTNIPLYTRAIMSKSNLGRHVTGNWYRYPEITDTINDNKTYACKDSTSTCCYSKTQLVNARDFSDGPAQKSTFIDPLNAIPYWRACDINMTSPWDDIEDSVRSRLNIYDEFVAWSGTYMVKETNGGSVPRYLWKVLRFDEEEAIAIIYVNGPSPSEADILCTNTCPYENSVPWIFVYNKYIYCCDVIDFLEAFNFQSTSIGGLFIRNGSLIEGSTALMVNIQKY